MTVTLALNRRNREDDRVKAIRILKGVINKYGQNPETCGILGRVYKDLYSDACEAGESFKASGYMESAIDWYKKGFEADPRDYYPGINAAMLLFEKANEEGIKEMEALIPVLNFAIGRRGGINSSDYWDVATSLQLSVLNQDWNLAERAAQKFGVIATHSWIVETTVNDLYRIKKTMIKNNREISYIENIINGLVEIQKTLP